MVSIGDIFKKHKKTELFNILNGNNVYIYNLSIYF